MMHENLIAQYRSHDFDALKANLESDEFKQALFERMRKERAWYWNVAEAANDPRAEGRNEKDEGNQSHAFCKLRQRIIDLAISERIAKDIEASTGHTSDQVSKKIGEIATEFNQAQTDLQKLYVATANSEPDAFSFARAEVLAIRTYVKSAIKPMIAETKAAIERNSLERTA